MRNWSGFKRSATHSFAEFDATIHALQQRESFLKMANTKTITDTTERKKVKRAARKKAAPKAKRTVPRGSNKQKVKTLARGTGKR